jgi:hypothetical protein
MLLSRYGENRDNRKNKNCDAEACEPEEGSHDTEEETYARAADRGAEEMRENYLQLLPSVST